MGKFTPINRVCLDFFFFHLISYLFNALQKMRSFIFVCKKSQNKPKSSRYTSVCVCVWRFGEEIHIQCLYFLMSFPF